MAYDQKLADAERQLRELKAAIEQIRTVCEDNFPSRCNKAMALDFVHQIAVAGRPTPAAEGG